MRALQIGFVALFAVALAQASMIQTDVEHVPGILLASAWSWANTDSVAQALAENHAVEIAYNPVLDFMTLSVDENASDTIIVNLEGSGLFHYVEHDGIGHPGTGAVPEPRTWLMLLGGLVLIQLVDRKAR